MITNATMSDAGAGAPAFDVDAAARSLWGKSARPGGRSHLLLQHLYDTAAVGEVMWDTYLPDGLRKRLNGITRGRGRQFFALMCGIHDVGKATPNFQSQVPELADRVWAAGLSWKPNLVSKKTSDWHHTRAGAAILRDELRLAGCPSEVISWFWPMIAGHHGRVPAAGEIDPPLVRHEHGVGERWRGVQAHCLNAVIDAAGFDSLLDAVPVGVPSRGDQLTILGLIVMADWIASNQDVFEAIDDPAALSWEGARQRAPQAWARLDLRGGWEAETLPEGDLVRARFAKNSRPIQQEVQRAAAAMAGPGLMILEAPMGEGKTEAALAAAEVFGHRFGARGLFVGLPTQATSDPMFHRVREWSDQVAPDVPIALLHGKRMFNREWRELADRTQIVGVSDDEFDCDPGYGPDSNGADMCGSASGAVVQWFLGAKRGLLTPLAIGTIDNLLHAGTRTRHVMLRHAGLAGKVVILDEVHAASVYMAQFLMESLRWLGSAGTPVILLTATLPPQLREELARAYLQGAMGDVAVDLSGMPNDLGYPGLLTVCAPDGEPVWGSGRSEPWRESQRVSVELLPDVGDDAGRAICGLLRTELADGGCVLVIRNTVKAAQQTYSTLREEFGDEVELLHARLTAAERSDRTERELGLLGPVLPDGPPRPRRHILVATQLAEQSFDVDADLLVTDLAPMDLLLQRIGRLHRHDRESRPACLAEPRVVVTGWQADGDAPPTFAGGSKAIYRRHRLLRTAALVAKASECGGWSVPRQVPELVAAAYGDVPIVPSGWEEAALEAVQEEADYMTRLVADAEPYLLTPVGARSPADLRGLHSRDTPLPDDDLAVAAVVREGEQSAEVLLVRRDEDGDMLTLSGRRLATGGALTSDESAIAEAVGSLVRLPAGKRVTKAVFEIGFPTEWEQSPLLRFLRPLVLDSENRGEIGGLRVQYDDQLGLLHEVTDRWRR